MFSLIKIELFPIKLAELEATAFAIGQVGPGSANAPHQTPSYLIIPWQKHIQTAPVLFSLLNWRTAISDFHGRDIEMDALYKWANSSEPPVSIRFITGGGGTGKSRLAAEFASKLLKEGWAAGFVRLDKLQTFPLNKKGTLLVIDYPEENRNAVEELFRDLAGVGEIEYPVRVLFLSRQEYDRWRDLVVDSHAAGLAIPVGMSLERFPERSAWDVFNSAQAKAAECYDSDHLPLSEEALLAWLAEQKTPENRPLYLVALALQSVLHPKEEVVRYSGPEVIQQLVERELSRLRNLAKSNGLQDPYAIARILAIATIIDGIQLVKLKELVKDPIFEMSFPSGLLEQILKNEQFLNEDRIVEALKPDTVAAAFVVEVFGQKPETAPELLWASIENNPKGGMDRLARLSFDAEIELGLHRHRLSSWLAQALDGRYERCELLDDIFSNERVSPGLIEAAIITYQTLLTKNQKSEQRARIYNKLSICMADAGDNRGALPVIRKAVEIYRRLAESNPTRFNRDLAGSLNNLSNLLDSAGGAFPKQ